MPITLSKSDARQKHGPNIGQTNTISNNAKAILIMLNHQTLMIERALAQLISTNYINSIYMTTCPNISYFTTDPITLSMDTFDYYKFSPGNLYSLRQLPKRLTI